MMIPISYSIVSILQGVSGLKRSKQKKNAFYPHGNVTTMSRPSPDQVPTMSRPCPNLIQVQSTLPSSLLPKYTLLMLCKVCKPEATVSRPGTESYAMRFTRCALSYQGGFNLHVLRSNRHVPSPASLPSPSPSLSPSPLPPLRLFLLRLFLLRRRGDWLWLLRRRGDW